MNIKSIIAITLISTFAMAAQAGDSTTGQQATVDGGGDSASSSIIVYRPKQGSPARLINYRVFVDGKSLGRLKSASLFSLDLAPGTHMIRINDKAKSAYSVNVEAGRTLVVKALVNRKIAVDFAVMEASAAIAEAPFVATAIQAAQGKVLTQLGSL